MVAFSSYYDAITAVDLFSADEELVAARQIEELDVEVWRCILQDPALKRWVKRKAGSVDPRALRGADPDREMLEQVLDGIHDRCGERELLQAVSRANTAALRARNAMAHANLRLVIKAARRFDFGMMPMADLVQEGNLGLLKAIGRYDHRRGVRFATYAVWWVNHSMRRAIAKHGRLVRLPVNVINGGHRVGKARRKLAGTLGRAPSAEDIAGAVDMSAEKVEHLQSVMAQREQSIDRQDGDDDSGPSFLEETAADDPSPADRLEELEVHAALRQAMSVLDEMEADIVRQRFGMDGRDEQTLARLGRQYGVSRERIRQIQVRALDKLRGVMAI